MELLLRTEICLIAVFLLIFLIYQIKRDSIVMMDDRMFQIIIYVSLLSVVLDFSFWLIDGKMFTGARIIAIIVNLIYFITCVFIPYIWLLYVDYRLYQNENRLRKRIVLYSIPLDFFWILLFSSPVTGWIFSIDQNNVYHRGPLYVIQLILTFLYLICASMLAFKEAICRDSVMERRDCYILASFIITPILGAVLQSLIFGLTTVSISIVISELMIFVNVQNKQLSLDALTQIYNRGYLNRYFDSRTKIDRKGQTLYMIILDINHFKEINDNYGHKEGDFAIINMANILRNACNSYRCFLARYGGDEFAIVHECKSDETIKEIIALIHHDVDYYNQTAEKPYQLSFSIGYAKYNEDQESAIESLLEEADNRMYIDKKNTTLL